MKRIFSCCFPRREDEDQLAYSLRMEDLRKIHKAVVNGELDKLSRKINSRRWNVNEKDRMGRTALHVACALGNIEAVKLLLEKNCLINPRDSFERTPLVKAIQCNNVSCSQLLLEHGADPNFLDIHGFSALHYAVIHDYRYSAELLINYSADIEAKDKSGQTALMIAEKDKKLKMVKLLTKNKAHIIAVEEEERNQHLVYACRKEKNKNNSPDKDSAPRRVLPAEQNEASTSTSTPGAQRGLRIHGKMDEDTERHIESRRRLFKELGAKVTQQIDNSGITPTRPGTPYVGCGLSEETDTSNGNHFGRRRRFIFTKLGAKVTPQNNNAEPDTLNENHHGSLPSQSGTDGTRRLNEETQEALHTPSSTDGPERDRFEEKIENNDGTQENCGHNCDDCATGSLDEEDSAKPATGPGQEGNRDTEDTPANLKIERKLFMKESEDTSFYPCVTAEPSIYSERLKVLHQRKMMTLIKVLRDVEEEEVKKMSLEYKIKELHIYKNTDGYSEILKCHQEARKRLRERYMSIGEFSFNLFSSFEDQRGQWESTDVLHTVDMKEFEDAPLDASFLEDFLYFEMHQRRNQRRIRVLRYTLSAWEMLEKQQMMLQCQIAKYNTDRNTEEYTEILQNYQETLSTLQESYMFISEYSLKFSRSFEDHGKQLSNTDLMP